MSAGASSHAIVDFVAAEPARQCAACEYDLRGLTVNRCPECGLEFDPDYLPLAEVPWLRRENSPLLAYWRTIALVLLWPRRFGDMVWRDVEVRASETNRFRWITIGMATGSALAAMLPAVGSGAAVIVLPLLAVPVTLFFWMATGRFNLIHFHADRFADELRYRRLHDMSCAGLGLSPLVPAIVLAGMIFHWRGDVIGWWATIGAWGVIAAWWLGSLSFQVRGGRCTVGDGVIHALLLPFAWLMIAVVILIFSLGVTGLVLSVFS